MQTPLDFWSLLLRCRRPLVIAIHVALILLSNYLAFWLRFDGAIPSEVRGLWWQIIPWLVLIRGATFIPFQLYQGLWRYTGIWDLRNIIAAVSISTLLFFGVIYWGFGFAEYPRSIFVMDSLLLIFFMGGVRLVRRLYHGMIMMSPRKRLLIYGAGDTGEIIVRDIKNNRDEYDYDPIGFIDDDRQKVGRRIHGVPVFGRRNAKHANIIWSAYVTSYPRLSLLRFFGPFSRMFYTDTDSLFTVPSQQIVIDWLISPAWFLIQG